MIPDGGVREVLPEPVRASLDEFREAFGLDIRLRSVTSDGRRFHLYPEGAEGDPAEDEAASEALPVHSIALRGGVRIELELRSPLDARARAATGTLHRVLERLFDFHQEVHFFTHEVSERYEEINLLYSISEILASILDLDEAARAILGEVCDVMDARRGSLWVAESPGADELRLVAFVGVGGLEGPIRVDDPSTITSQVFREGRPVILGRESPLTDADPPDLRLGQHDSMLSVPIRYTPPTGQSRTVGVINVVGQRREGRFSASDQKLLSAIASQIGAALENSRLVQESLARERIASEMELAHNLQMKLLPTLDIPGMEVAGRVVPAESVGGDFYNFFRLHGGRVGVMIGDVSSHGFPAALIMALSMSAAAIYASEVGTPGRVLRYLDDALRDELESTEMYLNLFYAVIDPANGEMTYANAGHPHAFVIHSDGSSERLPALDPPVGIAGPGSYDQRTIPWEAGSDLLLLFTDGLSDTLATRGRNSGEEVVLQRSIELRGGHPRELVEALFTLARETSPTIPADDRSAIVLRV